MKFCQTTLTQAIKPLNCVIPQLTSLVNTFQCDSHNMKLRESSVSQIHMLLRDLPVKPTELTDLQVFSYLIDYFCNYLILTMSQITGLISCCCKFDVILSAASVSNSL